MASLFVMTKPPTDIDYSLVDGRVRAFKLRGETLYDEVTGIAEDGWSDKLVDFVTEQGLDIDKGTGLHAFVYRMQEEGLHRSERC